MMRFTTETPGSKSNTTSRSVASSPRDLGRQLFRDATSYTLGVGWSAPMSLGVLSKPQAAPGLDLGAGRSLSFGGDGDGSRAIWQTFCGLSWLDLSDPVLDAALEEAHLAGRTYFQVSSSRGHAYHADLNRDPWSLRGFGEGRTRSRPLRRWLRQASIIEADGDSKTQPPLQSMSSTLFSMLYKPQAAAASAAAAPAAPRKRRPLEDERPAPSPRNPLKKKDALQIRLPLHGAVSADKLNTASLRLLAGTLQAIADRREESKFTRLEFAAHDERGSNVLKTDTGWYCSLHRDEVAATLGPIRDLADRAGIQHNFARIVTVNNLVDGEEEEPVDGIKTGMIHVPRVVSIFSVIYTDATGSISSWDLSQDGKRVTWRDGRHEAPPFKAVDFVASDGDGVNYLQTDCRWSSPLRQDGLGDTLGRLRCLFDTVGIRHNITDSMRYTIVDSPSRLDFKALRNDDVVVSTRGARGLPSSDFRRVRIFVWRGHEWHPVSTDEEEQLKKGLIDGDTYIRLGDGLLRTAVDTAARHGWVQADMRGITRRMTCLVAPGATSRYRDDVAAEEVGGEVDEAAISIFHCASRMSVPPPWECRQGVISVLEDEYREILQGATTLQRGVFSEAWAKAAGMANEDEWDARMLQHMGLRYEVRVTADPRRAYTAWEHRMVSARTHSPVLVKASPPDFELLRLTEALLFSLVDFAKRGRIELSEWVHFRLLEMQAPSQAAVEEIQERLSQRFVGEPHLLSRMVSIFMDACEEPWNFSEARITTARMREVARVWIEKHLAEDNEKQAVTNNKMTEKALGRLEMLTHSLDDMDYVSYYDYVNNMLGRSPVPVKLHYYDVSRSRAFGPDGLLGFAPTMSRMMGVTRREGSVWHCCLIVHGLEFWYGRRIHAYTPGCTPFGQPARVERLTGRTMRTVQEVWNYIHNDLRYEFTPEAYDVDRHCVNHLSDALCRYLTNEPIPEHLLRQPELASLVDLESAGLARSWAEMRLRAHIDQSLKAVFQKAGAGTEGHKRSSALAEEQDDWRAVATGSVVRYEYEPGWFCVGRIVGRQIDTVDLHWCDVHSGRLRLEEDVPKSCVRSLELATRSVLESEGSGYTSRRSPRSSTGGTPRRPLALADRH